MPNGERLFLTSREAVNEYIYVVDTNIHGKKILIPVTYYVFPKELHKTHIAIKASMNYCENSSEYALYTDYTLSELVKESYAKVYQIIKIPTTPKEFLELECTEDEMAVFNQLTVGKYYYYDELGSFLPKWKLLNYKYVMEYSSAEYWSINN
jgi:hypothetical protein